MPIEDFTLARDQRLARLRLALHHLAEGEPTITLEIGSGHGHFLTAYATARPGERCVGIDLIRDRLARSARKSQRAGLDNVSWVHAEAGEFLVCLPPAVRLGRIWVLFPDPWPKRRHWKNRLIQPAFLHDLAARAVPGAELCFRTDDADYFAFAREIVAEHPDWDLSPDPIWPFEYETVFQQRAPTHQSLIARRRASAA